jgi:D-alanyl-lipoteichoic acid acyltransferase DltB (MBOAT superfamily)
VLLIASMAYYLFSGQEFLILYPIASVGICCIGIKIIVGVKDRESALKAKGRNPERIRKHALIIVILCNVAVLFLLKYVNFGINTINGIAGFSGRMGNLLKGTSWLVPLGISYYSLSLMGYVVDVYYGRPGWLCMECFFRACCPGLFCVSEKMEISFLCRTALIMFR